VQGVAEEKTGPTASCIQHDGGPNRNVSTTYAIVDDDPTNSAFLDIKSGNLGIIKQNGSALCRRAQIRQCDSGRAIHLTVAKYDAAS